MSDCICGKRGECDGSHRPDPIDLDVLSAAIAPLRDTEPDGWEDCGNCGNCRQGSALDDLADIAEALIAELRDLRAENAALRELLDADDPEPPDGDWTTNDAGMPDYVYSDAYGHNAWETRAEIRANLKGADNAE